MYLTHPGNALMSEPKHSPNTTIRWKACSQKRLGNAAVAPSGGQAHEKMKLLPETSDRPARSRIALPAIICGLFAMLACTAGCTNISSTARRATAVAAGTAAGGAGGYLLG